VPGEAVLTLDVRSPVDAVRRQAVDSILAGARAIASQRRLDIAVDIGHDAAAAPCDPRFVGTLTEAVRACGLPPVLLPSGAGHDAMAFHGVLPFGMLFVRCHDGLSHHPDEYADPADIATGARVLSEFIRGFAAGTAA
jgi:allantoate deiminase